MAETDRELLELAAKAAGIEMHTNMFEGFTWDCACKLAELMGIDIHDVNRPGQRLPVPTKTLDWEPTP